MGNSFKVKWTTEGGETGVEDLEPQQRLPLTSKSLPTGPVIGIGRRLSAIWHWLQSTDIGLS